MEHYEKMDKRSFLELVDRCHAAIVVTLKGSNLEVRIVTRGRHPLADDAVRRMHDLFEADYQRFLDSRPPETEGGRA